MHLVIILVAISGYVIAENDYFNRDRLASKPPAMDNFDPAKALGKWYVTYANYPCRWSGADKFTDRYLFFTDDLISGSILAFDVWRKVEVCTRAPFLVTMTGQATYNIDDSIGDIISGNAVIVDTDYDNYLITWGCIQLSRDPNVCNEFWFDLRTRNAHPSAKTLRRVDEIFMRLWGVRTADIVKVQHDNPCSFKGEPDYTSRRGPDLKMKWNNLVAGF